MNEGKVVAAYLTSPDSVSTTFHLSWSDLCVWDITHERRIWEGGGVAHCYSSAEQVAESRNDVTANFLDRGEAEWLWFIDSDMGFPPDTLDRLVEVADPSRPIVGGLCFGQKIISEDRWNHLPLYRQFPTIYRWHETEHESGFVPYEDLQPDTLMRCNATGAACILLHRSALEAMRLEYGDTWWSKIPRAQTRGTWGEDMSFCLRAERVGLPIHVHTGVEVSHAKTHNLTLDSWLARPATPNVAVIPTKTFDLAFCLVGDLVKQDEVAEIIICDNGLTPHGVEALAAEGCTVLDCEGMGIHEMWNAGKDHAISNHGTCNIAFLNDDIEIGPNFLSGLAYELRRDPSLVVVCPNYDGRPPEGEVEYVDQICANRYDGTGGLAGFAFMVRGEFPYRFPEECKWWYGDNDLLLTVLSKGYTAGIVLGTSCVHLNGATGVWDDPAMRAQTDLDAKAFMAKWDLQPA